MKDFSRSQAVTFILNVAESRNWSRCYYRSLTGSNMAYQIAEILITLSDLQGHSPTASLSKCNFSYSFVTDDKVLTDIVQHAVPLDS